MMHSEDFKSQDCVSINTAEYIIELEVTNNKGKKVVPGNNLILFKSPTKDITKDIKKFNGKKKNYIIENTYIIQTAVSSPIKGAALVKIKYSN